MPSCFCSGSCSQLKRVALGVWMGHMGAACFRRVAFQEMLAEPQVELMLHCIILCEAESNYWVLNA